jgi:hypothetical protein
MTSQSEIKCMDKISKQVYLCPASSKNMVASIDHKFAFNNGVSDYSWAFNERFVQKWNNMEVGALCVFGNTKDGFRKAAFVKSKMDLQGVENWPFRSPSGAPWRWGYTLTTPFYVNFTADDIKLFTGVHSWPTQNILSDIAAENIRFFVEEIQE